MRVRGIPVTSVPRTMFDLAATRSEREVERAWNEMEVRGFRDRLSVPHLLERYPGRKGSLVLARLAERKELPVGITRNDLEEAFLALIDRFGLPRPRMNAHLAVRDRFYEIDCLWEDRRVAIELDGGAAHKTTKAFHDDRERDRILTAEGFTTARVTWDHIHRHARRSRRRPAAHPHSVPFTQWIGSSSTTSFAMSRVAARCPTTPSPAPPEAQPAATSPASPSP